MYLVQIFCYKILKYISILVNILDLIVDFCRPKNRKDKMEGDQSDKENKREEQNIKKKKRSRSSSSGSSSSR